MDLIPTADLSLEFQFDDDFYMDIESFNRILKEKPDPLPHVVNVFTSNEEDLSLGNISQAESAHDLVIGIGHRDCSGWDGQALFGTLTSGVIVLTLLYSIAGLGIGIVNDFKSIEGDKALGLQSLPVAFGAETAKWICVGAIDITQLSIAGAGKPYYALTLLALVVPQVVFQIQYFLKDPVKYDVKYQASAQPFLVLGLLVTALSTSH